MLFSGHLALPCVTIRSVMKIAICPMKNNNPRKTIIQEKQMTIWRMSFLWFRRYFITTSYISNAAKYRNKTPEIIRLYFIGYKLARLNLIRERKFKSGIFNKQMFKQGFIWWQKLFSKEGFFSKLFHLIFGQRPD